MEAQNSRGEVGLVPEDYIEVSYIVSVDVKSMEEMPAELTPHRIFKVTVPQKIKQEKNETKTKHSVPRS